MFEITIDQKKSEEILKNIIFFENVLIHFVFIFF